MEFSWSFDLKKIDWAELSELIRIAPLTEKTPDHVKTVFSNSKFKCFVFRNSQLVGAGRALADGLDCSYICDVVVHPDFQGMGLGQQIVQYLIEQSKGHKKIILYANPGKEVFYHKLGLKRMNTALALFENEAEMIRKGVLSN
ncbi:MAG: GNAT family N-acetyltransferase [Anaerolineales bacterium]|nr:GNAT family N-acetyltransferase [Anaerolineales bacterium]